MKFLSTSTNSFEINLREALLALSVFDERYFIVFRIFPKFGFFANFLSKSLISQEDNYMLLSGKTTTMALFLSSFLVFLLSVWQVEVLFILQKCVISCLCFIEKSDLPCTATDIYIFNCTEQAQS
jgi:hypothetical protein